MICLSVTIIVGDIMDKTLYKYFLVYATVLNKIDAASESDELRFSSEERNAYIKVHEAAENNEKISEFLRKIKECNSADRLRIVEDFFVRKEEPKNEEKEIAKVYGIDSKNIQSKVSNTVTADILDFPQKSNFDDLNSMLKDDVISDVVNSASKSNPDELNYMLSHTDKESKEVTDARGGQSDTKKARVLSIFRNNPNSANDNDLDKAGFVNNIIFVLLMASVFVALIIEILYFI